MGRHLSQQPTACGGCDDSELGCKQLLQRFRIFESLELAHLGYPYSLHAPLEGPPCPASFAGWPSVRTAAKAAATRCQRLNVIWGVGTTQQLSSVAVSWVLQRTTLQRSVAAHHRALHVQLQARGLLLSEAAWESSRMCHCAAHVRRYQP